MTIDPLSIGAGAAIGAVAADAYEDAKDKVSLATGGEGATDHHLMQLRMIAESISLIEKYIREANLRNVLQIDERVVSLPPNGAAFLPTPYTLHRRGFKHVSVLAKGATSIQVNTAIGAVTFALSTGWNALDLPDQADLWVVGAAAVNVIIHWGDEALSIPGV